MKNTLINECMDLLKRDDVKSEFKNFMTPIVDLILVQINPYLYLCMMFVIISFLLYLFYFCVINLLI